MNEQGSLFSQMNANKEDSTSSATEYMSPVSSGRKGANEDANKTLSERLITKEELQDLITQLGLSTRKKLPKALNTVTLIELQIAAAKYYFTTQQVLSIMYTFNDDSATQARVVVCLFSRIWDLWDFDIVARQLSVAALQEVVVRIGWLNLMNPLKPSYEFVLPLTKLDNRLHTIHLLEMCAAESGDQLKENPNSDLTIVQLFGKIASLAYDNKLVETVMLAYCDFGEVLSPINWNFRKEMMKKYLVGTAPIPSSAYDPIAMYNEMQSAGTLSLGPIDIQYQSHLQNPKVKRRVKNLLKNALAKPNITAVALGALRKKREEESTLEDEVDV